MVTIEQNLERNEINGAAVNQPLNHNNFGILQNICICFTFNIYISRELFESFRFSFQSGQSEYTMIYLIALIISCVSSFEEHTLFQVGLWPHKCYSSYYFFCYSLLSNFFINLMMCEEADFIYARLYFWFCTPMLTLYVHIMRLIKTFMDRAFNSLTGLNYKSRKVTFKNSFREYLLKICLKVFLDELSRKSALFVVNTFIFARTRI